MRLLAFGVAFVDFAISPFHVLNTPLQWLAPRVLNAKGPTDYEAKNTEGAIGEREPVPTPNCIENKLRSIQGGLPKV